MFRVSPETAKLVVNSQAEPHAVSHLMVSSNQRPAHEKDEAKLDVELIQTAVGERLIRFLGTIARRRKVSHRTSLRFMVVSDSGEFSPDIIEGLEERLGLLHSYDASKAAIQGIAADLREWVQKNRTVGGELGLILDHGAIFKDCGKPDQSSTRVNTPPAPLEFEGP